MNNTEILKKVEKILGHRLWCRGAFEELDFFDSGLVYNCCPHYTNDYSFGNIFNQTFDDIWNGDKAKEFRQSIIDGNFKYCNLGMCLPLNSLVNNYRFDVDEKGQLADINKQGPDYIQLNIERACNVRCITCRDCSPKPDDKETFEKKKEIFDNVIMPLCKNAIDVFINGAGEVFAGKLSLYAMKKISTTYPNIKFLIITNGILFNEKMYEKCGLKNRIRKIAFSIHAFNKETYEKIVIGGNFEKVKQNVEFAAMLKKKGEIDVVSLNFVVNVLNYKEMIDFQKWANELDVEVHFSDYRKWGAKMDENYDEYAIFEPTHPQYKEYLKIVENDIFKSPNCEINLKLKPN